MPATTLTDDEKTAAGVAAAAFAAKTSANKVVSSIGAMFSDQQEVKWAAFTNFVMGVLGTSLALGMTDEIVKRGPFASPIWINPKEIVTEGLTDGVTNSLADQVKRALLGD